MRIFDFVMSNHVFEQVENLDLVLGKIVRVLKPGGQMLSLFQSRDVVREGHCGVPMIRWFSMDSILRYPYMRSMQAVGLFQDSEKRAGLGH